MKPPTCGQGRLRTCQAMAAAPSVPKPIRGIQEAACSGSYEAAWRGDPRSIPSALQAPLAVQA